MLDSCLKGTGRLCHFFLCYAKASYMHCFTDASHTPASLKGCVLAIGNFDGVHRGHLSVLMHAKERAALQGRPWVVMSFFPHPRQYFAPDTPAQAIESLPTRLRRIRALGADGLLLLRFNAALAALEAEAFIEQILVAGLAVKHIVVGKDFCFGRGRRGDIALLRAAATAHGFVCEAVPPLSAADGTPISSTRIRTALSNGDMQEASILLGRPYSIIGRVIHGDKRGRTLATPTANLSLKGLHPSRYGVYAVQHSLDGEATWQHGVANLGVRPTFGEGSVPLLEVHSFEALGDVYGQRMSVRLLAHLRDEQSFTDVAALKHQIALDIAQAKQILNHI
jgi:riboflavin kinase / FMN adenylyltransferase